MIAVAGCVCFLDYQTRANVKQQQQQHKKKVQKSSLYLPDDVKSVFFRAKNNPPRRTN